MKKRLLIILVALIILSAPAYAAGRVILLSWDGGADWIMDRMVKEGKLPNVKKLASNGVSAEYMTTSFPSLTAAAHASIWTGAWLNRNGITGNSVPRTPFSEYSLTETISGFDARALTAEPIWLTAVRSGKRAAVLQATQTEPTEVVAAKLKADNIPQDRLFVSTGFRYSISPAGILDDLMRWLLVVSNFSVFHGTPVDMKDTSVPIIDMLVQPGITNGRIMTRVFSIGDTRFNVYAYDLAADPVKGFDTVAIEQYHAPVRTILKLGWSTPSTIDKFSQPIKVTKDGRTGYVRFRLFELSPDGERIILYHTAVNALDSNQPDKANAMLEAAGGFLDDEFDVYESGKLGKPIPVGGDGTAERRLMELVRLDIDKLKKSTAWGIKNLKWELLLNYSPNIDAAEHAWLGVLDPQSPSHNPDMAKKLWPYLEQVYRINDEWLGHVINCAPKDANVILVSDHGMEGVSKRFYANRLLEKAGLAVLDSKGVPIPASSKAIATGDGASIYVNTTVHKNGIVPPDQKDQVMSQAKELLLSHRDQNGRGVVNKVYTPKDAPEVGLGGPKGADLMIDFSTGYTGSARGGTGGSIISPIEPIGLGMHGGWPYKTKLRAVFYASGPAFARGKKIPPMRTIDIAPTISRILGIRKPAQAVGIRLPTK